MKLKLPRLDDVSIPKGQRSSPGKRCKCSPAECAHDAQAVLRTTTSIVCIRPFTGLYEAQTHATRTKLLNSPQYDQPNVIERVVGWLEENRRIVRSDYLVRNHAVMAAPASSCPVCYTFFMDSLVSAYDSTPDSILSI